jgi:hypothetical protein
MVRGLLDAAMRRPQRAGPDLPHGLDVRHGGARVLSVLWADGGASEVVTVVRGPGRDEALAP